MYQSFCPVVIPPTISENDLKFILSHSEVLTVATSCEHVGKIAAAKSADPAIKLANIVCFNAVAEEARTQAEAAGLTLHTFESLIDKGRGSKG
jgi:long-subunit acyl-CoA synthetase (AMP-forming)